MLNLFIGEFLGTFIFLSAIIFSVGFNPNDMLILFKVKNEQN